MPCLQDSTNNRQRAPLAVYIHIPFCPSKCGYCDFNSYGMGADGKRGLSPDLIPKTVAAICDEIEQSPYQGWPSKTIFFGGGTPTYLAPSQLRQILQKVQEVHPPIERCEITTEANPGTVDAEKFVALHSLGFNRISIGVQSFQDDELVRLGRVHRASEAEVAYTAAKNAGFDNVNLDLMFALPGQAIKRWASNLQRALALQPQHLSLYCLTIEAGTAFSKQLQSGKLNDLPSHDDQAEMFELARELTQSHGYENYEISNFAQNGFQCQHNLAYWNAEYYAGYGPGAVAFLPLLSEPNHPKSTIGVRRTNLKHPSQYCTAVLNHQTLELEREEITASIHETERIMLGLRLSCGLDLQTLSIPKEKIDQVIRFHWAKVIEDRLILTPLGQALCTEVTIYLMGN